MALIVGVGVGTARGFTSVEGDAAAGAVGKVIGYAIAVGLIAVVEVSVVLALTRR